MIILATSLTVSDGHQFSPYVHMAAHSSLCMGQSPLWKSKKTRDRKRNFIRTQREISVQQDNMRTGGIETQRDKNTGRYLYIKVNPVFGKRYYYNKTYFIGLIGSGGFKQTHHLFWAAKYCVLSDWSPTEAEGERPKLTTVMWVLAVCLELWAAFMSLCQSGSQWALHDAKVGGKKLQ